MGLAAPHQKQEIGSKSILAVGNMMSCLRECEMTEEQPLHGLVILARIIARDMHAKSVSVSTKVGEQRKGFK